MNIKGGDGEGAVRGDLGLSLRQDAHAGDHDATNACIAFAMQVYSSPQEFWDEVEANRLSGEGPQWYRQAVDYWDSQEASDNGVLGGFEELTEVDIADSKKFILKVCRMTWMGGDWLGF